MLCIRNRSCTVVNIEMVAWCRHLIDEQTATNDGLRGAGLVCNQCNPTHNSTDDIISIQLASTSVLALP